MENMLLQEQYALVATIDPANVTDTHSDYIDMSKFHEVLGILLTGNMSAHAIDFAVYGYSDTSATGVTEIKAITQLAADAALNDNAQAMISVRNEDVLAKANSSGYALRYVRFRIVSGSQTGYSAAVVLGKPKKGLASAENLSTVAEVETDRS